jgi:hypothetical protein
MGATTLGEIDEFVREGFVDSYGTTLFDYRGQGGTTTAGIIGMILNEIHSILLDQSSLSLSGTVQRPWSQHVKEYAQSGPWRDANLGSSRKIRLPGMCNTATLLLAPQLAAGNYNWHYLNIRQSTAAPGIRLHLTSKGAAIRDVIESQQMGTDWFYITQMTNKSEARNNDVRLGMIINQLSKAGQRNLGTTIRIYYNILVLEWITDPVPTGVMPSFFNGMLHQTGANNPDINVDRWSGNVTTWPLLNVASTKSAAYTSLKAIAMTLTKFLDIYTSPNLFAEDKTKLDSFGFNFRDRNILIVPVYQEWMFGGNGNTEWLFLHLPQPCVGMYPNGYVYTAEVIQDQFTGRWTNFAGAGSHGVEDIYSWANWVDEPFINKVIFVVVDAAATGMGELLISAMSTAGTQSIISIKDFGLTATTAATELGTADNSVWEYFVRPTNFDMAECRRRYAMCYQCPAQDVSSAYSLFIELVALNPMPTGWRASKVTTPAGTDNIRKNEGFWLKDVSTVPTGTTLLTDPWSFTSNDNGFLWGLITANEGCTTPTWSTMVTRSIASKFPAGFNTSTRGDVVNYYVGELNWQTQLALATRLYEPDNVWSIATNSFDPFLGNKSLLMCNMLASWCGDIVANESMLSFWDMLTMRLAERQASQLQVWNQIVQPQMQAILSRAGYDGVRLTGGYIQNYWFSAGRDSATTLKNPSTNKYMVPNRIPWWIVKPELARTIGDQQGHPLLKPYTEKFLKLSDMHPSVVETAVIQSTWGQIGGTLQDVATWWLKPDDFTDVEWTDVCDMSMLSIVSPIQAITSAPIYMFNDEGYFTNLFSVSMQYVIKFAPLKLGQYIDLIDAGATIDDSKSGFEYLKANSEQYLVPTYGVLPLFAPDQNVFRRVAINQTYALQFTQGAMNYQLFLATVADGSPQSYYMQTNVNKRGGALAWLMIRAKKPKNW